MLIIVGILLVSIDMIKIANATIFLPTRTFRARRRATPSCISYDSQLPPLHDHPNADPNMYRGIGIRNEILRDIRSKIMKRRCRPRNHQVHFHS